MAIQDGRHLAPDLVSVIIPVRNGAATLGAQLEALGQQTYRGQWEIVIADNGSTDATEAVATAGAPAGIALRIIDASARPGSSFARNSGAEDARGDFLAFCDADDIVTPGWLAALADAALEYDVVTGPQDATALNDPDVQAWRPPRAQALPTSGFLPYAPSCNLGVWADVYKRTGGFSEDYPQAHDVEWSWRAQLLSCTFGFAPDAVVQYRYRATIRGVARQAYASGIDAARLYRDYETLGMQHRTARDAARLWVWLVARSPYLASRPRRGIWMRRAAEAWGRIVGSARFRVVFL
jgi:glycosyltransferase involved in cell wall biosynthesis